MREAWWWRRDLICATQSREKGNADSLKHRRFFYSRRCTDNYRYWCKSIVRIIIDGWATDDTQLSTDSHVGHPLWHTQMRHFLFSFLSLVDSFRTTCCTNGSIATHATRSLVKRLLWTPRGVVRLSSYRRARRSRVTREESVNRWRRWGW